MKKDLVLGVVVLLLASVAEGQGTPPFEIVPAGSNQNAALNLNLSDMQGSQTRLDVTGQASGENQQRNSNGGGRVFIGVSTSDIDTFCDDSVEADHNFAVLYWDTPYDSSDPFQEGADQIDFSQEMFYRVLGVGCGDDPEAPLYAIAASSHDFAAGTIDVRAHAATNNYGYDSVAGTNGYGHYAQAQASANLADWLYVTGPNPTATVTMVASLNANFGSVPMPLNPSDWYSQAFDLDIRELDPCGDYEQPDFFGDAEPPEGMESSELSLNLSLRDNFVSHEVCVPEGEGEGEICSTSWTSTNHGDSAYRIDEVTYEWVDTEGSGGDCSDDVLEATREEEGSLPGSVMVQVDVATNQWIQVRAGLTAESSCDTPLLCDLINSTGAPTQLSITSPNGTLVAWHGIAGIQSIPEPASGVVAALGALALLARRKQR